jgi:hypothetical protein
MITFPTKSGKAVENCFVQKNLSIRVQWFFTPIDVCSYRFGSLILTGDGCRYRCSESSIIFKG